jgi:hypothetical protein
MRFITARQAWHDAYAPDVKSHDYQEMINTFGIQTTSKGAGNKVLDHCERAKVQAAVAELEKADPVAKAWGMFSYAPDGMCSAKDRGRLLDYLAAQYNEWTEFEHRTNDAHMTKIKMLARLVMHNEAKRDLGIDQRQEGDKNPRYNMELPRKIVGCANDVARWDEEWKPTWRKLVCWLEPLPARALTPVGHVVYDYQDKLSAA